MLTYGLTALAAGIALGLLLGAVFRRPRIGRLKFSSLVLPNILHPNPPPAVLPLSCISCVSW